RTQALISSFERRLADLGWTEGRNVRFEQRWSADDMQLMHAHIADVVGIRPDVIVAQNTPMIAALRRQTTTIPIVFLQVSDPVGAGFVESLPRPGGNVTGFTNTMASLGGKWLELLREAAPGVSQVGFLFNRAASPGGGTFYFEPFQAAAAAMGVKTVQLEVSSPDAIEGAIAAFAAAGGNGIVAESNSFLFINRDYIISALNRQRLPGTFPTSPWARAGGLLSYGTDAGDQWLAAAVYVDRILRGETAGEMPVQQPSKFELA